MFFNVTIKSWHLEDLEFSWDELRLCWPADLPDERPDKLWSLPLEDKRMTHEELGNLVKVFGNKSDDIVQIKPGDTGLMVTKMTDHSSRKWSYGETPMPDDYLSGAAVQITIPDLALMNMNEVMHLDDSCTDVLQSQLDKGWRILAVCPPNAQRRPDYILGRRK